MGGTTFVTERKAEVLKADIARLEEKAELYGYIILPLVREGALKGDAACVSAVEKLMKRSQGNNRFKSADSVAEWLDANEYIVDVLEEYLAE